MTEKQFKFKRFNVENINKLSLYEIDNNPSDDLDESNLFYVFSMTDANVQDIVDKLNKQEEIIQKYKHLIKIATTLIRWNTIPQVCREWEKHLNKAGDVDD